MASRLAGKGPFHPRSIAIQFSLPLPFGLARPTHMMNPRQFAELSENGDEPTLEKPGRDASLEPMRQSLGLLPSNKVSSWRQTDTRRGRAGNAVDR